MDFIAAYLDDLNVFSKSFEEHLTHLRQIFELCAQNNLKLKWSKNQIAVSEIYFVGYQVNADGIQSNPKKKEALEKLQPPKNLKELRSFLSLGNYFRRFIKDYSAVVRPLTVLTQKDQVYDWTPECQNAYLEVKSRLTSAPILAHFAPVRETSVSTDASKYALGAVLEQVIEGILRPVAYFSARLSSAEMNYTTMEKKALGVARALMNWRIELVGIEFVVYTDNFAVASVLSMRDLNGRIARWVHKLSDFNFTLKHRSGKVNVVADFLPRMNNVENNEAPHALANIPRNNEPLQVDAVPYSEESLVRFRLAIQSDVDNNHSSGENLRNFRQQYPTMWKRKNEFNLVEGVLMKHHKGMILKVLYPSEFQSYLFSLHNSMGHFGFQTLWNFLSCRVWDPGLRCAARSYVRACVSCQQFDLRRGDYRFSRPMTCHSLFSVIAIVYAGPFPAMKVTNTC